MCIYMTTAWPLCTGMCIGTHICIGAVSKHVQVSHMYTCDQYIRNRRMKENKMGQFDFI